jgi:lipid II:glycine glycyltransferase (peptidoglycan interpeptide bridge formation enzyme)
MKLLLCRAQEAICAGAICSAIGRNAVYLFGATSNAGMKSRGSYFLQWKLVEYLKRAGIAVYDLNGINPAKNPGTYKFKADLAGVNATDAYFMGRFDAHAGAFGKLCTSAGDTLRVKYRAMKKSVKASKPEESTPQAGKADQVLEAK